MRNAENVIKNKITTTEEARKRGRNGGIASGKARAKKKLMSQIYAEIMSEEYEIIVDGKIKKVGGEKYLKEVIGKILDRNDRNTVAIAKEMRQATEGDRLIIDGGLDLTQYTDEELDNKIKEMQAEIDELSRDKKKKK